MKVRKASFRGETRTKTICNGLADALVPVVLNTDKAHSHVHVLLTTIDEEGKSIPSGNNYSRSEKISRELEQKYGLLPLEREGGKRTTLGEEMCIRDRSR